MGVEQVEQWVGLMQRGGGWAVAIILSGVVVVLWRETKSLNRQIITILTKTNELMDRAHPEAVSKQEG